MRIALSLAIVLTSGSAQGDVLAAPAPTSTAADPHAASLAQALEARARGDLTTALTLLRQLHLTAPDQRNIETELATTLAWNHQLLDAYSHFKALATSAPEDLQMAVSVARIEGWLERYDDARQHLHAVLRRDPHHVDALLTLGMMETAALHRDVAEQAFRRVLQQDSSNAQARQGLRESSNATRIGIKVIAEYRAGQDVYSLLGLGSLRLTPRTTLLVEGGQVSPIAADPASQPSVEWRVAAGASHRGKKVGGALMLENLPSRSIGGVQLSLETSAGRVHAGAMGRVRSDGSTYSVLTNLWTLVDLPATWAIGFSLYGSQELAQRRLAVRGRVVLPARYATTTQLIGERRGDGQYGFGAIADVALQQQRQLGVSLTVWPGVSQAWLTAWVGLRL